MTYTPSNVKQLTSRAGKPFWKCTMQDMNGQVYENVTAFIAVQDGVIIDGELERNDYNGQEGWKFNSQPAARPNAKSAQISQVMEKKQESINHSMDRKEQAIAHAGSITNASNFFIALLEKGIIEVEDEKEAQEKVREYIAWYQTLYENPGSASKNPNDIPF